VGVALALAGTAVPLASQDTVELPGRDRELDLALEEVFSVGTFDGADWETFGEVRDVGFDGAGNLYVMDVQSSRMIVVDRNGEFVRIFGTRGEGPGEWRQPAGAAVLRDGRVVVADMGHRAYQIYDAQGEYTGSVRFGGGAVTMVGDIQADPRGTAVYNGGGSTMISVEAEGGAEPQMPEGRPIRRAGLTDGGAEEVFYEAWAPPPEEPRQTSAGGGMSFVSIGGPPVFAPRLHAAVLPDGGLAVVDSSAWLVKLVGPDGRERRRLSRPIEAEEVTSRIERQEIERQLAELESGQGPRMRIVTDDGGGEREMPQSAVEEMMRERIQNRGFYPVIPVVRGMAAGWDGTLWLERRAEGDPTADGPVDLIAPEGEYLGTVDASGPGIPDAFGPDGLVAYVERDEMDVPRVVVRRLPPELR
jgi:hypothetical protein